MTTRTQRLQTLLLIAMLAFATPLWARGGGGARGGGSRGGGSVSRGGGGSIRHSSGGSRPPAPAPRPSMPAARPAPVARPAAPVVNRPAAPIANRPAAPVANRPATPVVNPAAAAALNRPGTGVAAGVGTTYRPANMGAITAAPAMSRAGGIAVGAAGGLAVGHQQVGRGSSAAVVGPGGSSAAAIRGPGGGVGGVVRGPAGGVAAGVRGPAGGAVGAARGPWGNAAAVARLPNGAASVRWNGNEYWRNGGRWYSPYWQGDTIWYAPTYPPVGWYTSSIGWDDAPVDTVVLDGQTYYESDGVYYEKSTQNGQEGYAVVEEPKQATVKADPSLPDPFDVLKKGLAYLADQSQFTMTVSDTYDEVAEGGQKVSFTTRRDICVRRPQNVAVEFQGEGESRRAVLDGRNFTLVDKTKKSYGQVAVPPTIDEALDKLAADYGVVVAVGDLLRAKLYDRVSSKIQTGQYLGKDTVAVYPCDHLGFTTPDADWEAWFQTGDRPLLRKFSIAYKNVPSRPRYTMTIVKFEAAPVSDYLLKAEIPPAAQQVSLTPRAAQEATTQPAGSGGDAGVRPSDQIPALKTAAVAGE